MLMMSTGPFPCCSGRHRAASRATRGGRKTCWQRDRRRDLRAVSSYASEGRASEEWLWLSVVRVKEVVGAGCRAAADRPRDRLKQFVQGAKSCMSVLRIPALTGLIVRRHEWGLWLKHCEKSVLHMQVWM